MEEEKIQTILPPGVRGEKNGKGRRERGVLGTDLAPGWNGSRGMSQVSSLGPWL